MLPVDPNLEKYIESYSSDEDTVLSGITRYTYQNTVSPQMISGHLQGIFLELISRMIVPSRILEIGTFTGYGTICLSKGLAPGGRIITIEKNDELEAAILASFVKAGISGSVTLLTGDALELIPRLNEYFDLVFIDGEKPEYPEYYSLISCKVKPGGIILADNTLWGGKVVNADKSKDPYTKGIHQFNKMVKEDNSVTVVILPVRDGLSVIRKK